VVLHHYWQILTQLLEKGHISKALTTVPHFELHGVHILLRVVVPLIWTHRGLLVLVLRVRKLISIGLRIVPAIPRLRLLRSQTASLCTPVVSSRLLLPISLGEGVAVVISIVEAHLECTLRIANDPIIVAIEAKTHHRGHRPNLIVISVNDDIDPTTSHLQPVVVTVHS
jgi:hypothetical protein